MVTCTGHIGIHEGADGRTYVRTDVDHVMAIKPNFLTSMGYHIFLTMVLRARAPSARAELAIRTSKYFSQILQIALVSWIAFEKFTRADMASQLFTSIRYRVQFNLMKFNLNSLKIKVSFNESSSLIQ